MCSIDFYDDACVLEQMEQVSWSHDLRHVMLRMHDSYCRDCNPPVNKCEMRKSSVQVKQVKAEFIVGFRFAMERQKVHLEYIPLRRMWPA